MKTKILAIIPARSGSKGILNKNIKMLNGKPLIAYTIIEAIKSGIFDEIIVTTDSQQYANIAEKYGATIRELRPKELSKDETPSYKVIDYVISKEKSLNNFYELFMLLQPTSPLRDCSDIINAYNLYRKSNAKSIISVSKFNKDKNTINTLKSLSLSNFCIDINKSRRQDCEYFYINGAIYLMEVEEFLSSHNFYNEDSLAYIMPKEKSIDIDDIYDFILAEEILKRGNL